MKYYKGKFLIGVYSLLSDGETLIALCDNVKEFAEYMDITQDNASMILKNLYEKKHKFIRKNKKLRTVEFINYEEIY